MDSYVLLRLLVSLVFKCEMYVVVGDEVSETFSWLAANLSVEQCSNLINGLKANNVPKMEIETNFDCDEMLKNVFKNSTEDDAVQKIIQQLTKLNETQLAKRIRSQKMLQDVEVLRDYEMELKSNSISGLVRLDQVNKLNSEVLPLAAKVKADSVSGVKSSDLIVTAGLSSVFLLLLILYLTSLLWVRLTATPQAYLTSEFDLLLH